MNLFKGQSNLELLKLEGIDNTTKAILTANHVLIDHKDEINQLKGCLGELNNQTYPLVQSLCSIEDLIPKEQDEKKFLEILESTFSGKLITNISESFLLS